MSTAVAMEVAPAPGEMGLDGQIDALQKQAAEMRATKARVTKELKNAQKRKRRLQTKVRALSDQDFLAVMLMRRDTGGVSSNSAGPNASAAEAAGDVAGRVPA